MVTAEDRLMQWLRDAHAMEEQAVTMLDALAKRIENYADVRAKVEEHLAVTREQSRRLESCITARGGDTSTIKDLAGKVTAMSQGIGGMFAADEIVKGAMALYTFEHMEIASYRVLVAAAEEVGDTATAAVLQAILDEEIEAAHWVGEMLPDITVRYLKRDEATGIEAKR
ncbi:ferritin-like domain-containing protein [Kaistia geumhonensis]|uniref:Ferritin-like metal-binding protein YciE n=1 Tax=Kaistia geumhonensis TaxID=410839 RepID=A0ABU0M0Y4_9HYPH|nr:ferritin-like domain-containing protein [Kaistia geumhonensis]MCX5480158.1 ferritin-like domain-containing protein [Kaistia geumhonensis]MDQ0514613.1 ferritin-like metal-binding protein YciE [Kaistia geumhonensis]